MFGQFLGHLAGGFGRHAFGLVERSQLLEVAPERPPLIERNRARVRAPGELEILHLAQPKQRAKDAVIRSIGTKRETVSLSRVAARKRLATSCNT